MNEELVIASGIELNAAAPAWVQLFPREAVEGKSWFGRNGLGPYRIPDIASFLKATANVDQLPDIGSRRASTDLYVDYDHLLDIPEANVERRAAGWIKEIEARADGVWGRIEWTEAASKAIAGKEYRFISPSFMRTASGQILRVIGAGLTNKPNFAMKALASETDSKNARITAHLTNEQFQHRSGDAGDIQPKEQFMDKEQSAALCAALELPENADAAQIVTAAQTARDQVKALGEKVGLKDKPVAEIVTAAQSRLTDLSAGKYVEKSAVENLEKQIASLKDEAATQKAERAVDDAMEEGKITAAEREFYVDIAKENPERFGKMMAARPVILQPGSVAATLASQQQTGETAFPTLAHMNVDPERLALHQRALKYQAEHKDVTYAQALKAVS